MTLKNIFCQDKAVLILQKAYINGKWAHAYIFAGPDGVGKYTAALAWAKLLLCQKPLRQEGFSDSCGICQSCKLLDSGAHPDCVHIYKELLEFTEEGKGKTTPIEFPIDVIREFLIAKVSQKPAVSKNKVYVISEAEKLNHSSQNAMLKVLEEPPDYCSIILLTCRPENLLATIKSRCQTIGFGSIDEKRITEHLIKTGLEQSTAKYLARLSQGSLGLASAWSRLELDGAGLYQTKKQIIDCLGDYKYSQSLEIAGQFLEKAKSLAEFWVKHEENTSKSDINRRALKIIIRIIISALSDASKLEFIDPNDLINFDQQTQIKKIASKFDMEQAAVKLADCCENINWIDSNVNEKLVFERMLLNLADYDIIGV